MEQIGLIEACVDCTDGESRVQWQNVPGETSNFLARAKAKLTCDRTLQHGCTLEYPIRVFLLGPTFPTKFRKLPPSEMKKPYFNIGDFHVSSAQELASALENRVLVGESSWITEEQWEQWEQWGESSRAPVVRPLRRC